MPPIIDIPEGADPIDVQIEDALRAGDSDYEGDTTNASAEGAQQTATPPSDPSQHSRGQPSGTDRTGGDPQRATQPDTQQTQSRGGTAAQPTGQQRQSPGQQQRQQPERGTLRPGERPRSDEQGNLVDAQGRIVAAAGGERRQWERATRLEREVAARDARINTLEQEAQRAQSWHGEISRRQLTRADALFGLDFVARMRANPVEAARIVVAETLKAGHTIQSILGSQEGSPVSAVETQALRGMIDEVLQPVRQQQEQQASETERREAANRALHEYVRSHEYADQHLGIISGLMQRNPGMSPEQAYYEVRRYADINNLDFSRPFDEQIRERQAQQAQNSTGQSNGTSATPGTRTEPPMPQGVNASGVQQQQQRQANIDDDWDTIVRTSMREAGMSR